MMQVEEPVSETRGVPAWVTTFADLMTLLMCFFVLLLSFSEMDVVKFKMLSGSMKDAFGVQTEVEVRTIPKGTSVIAQEFSPGRPDPTALNEVRQFTIDSNKNSLDALSEEMQEIEEARKHARRILAALNEEIKKGSVAVEVRGAKVIIRILEKASFGSGEAEIRSTFVPVLRLIAGLIDSHDGLITVSGHTDNIPISNSRFRSNWDLSTSRAPKEPSADSRAATAMPSAITKGIALTNAPRKRPVAAAFGPYSHASVNAKGASIRAVSFEPSASSAANPASQTGRPAASARGAS